MTWWETSLFPPLNLSREQSDNHNDSTFELYADKNVSRYSVSVSNVEPNSFSTSERDPQRLNIIHRVRARLSNRIPWIYWNRPYHCGAFRIVIGNLKSDELYGPESFQLEHTNSKVSSSRKDRETSDSSPPNQNSRRIFLSTSPFFLYVPHQGFQPRAVNFLIIPRALVGESKHTIAMWGPTQDPTRIKSKCCHRCYHRENIFDMLESHDEI